MRKNVRNKLKLSLNKETVRKLNPADLKNVVGGLPTRATTSFNCGGSRGMCV